MVKGNVYRFASALACTAISLAFGSQSAVGAERVQSGSLGATFEAAALGPDISVSPTSFSEGLFTGQSVTRTLSIDNTGGSDLHFNLSIRGSAAAPASARAVSSLRDPVATGGAAVPSPVDFRVSGNTAQGPSRAPLAGTYSGTYLAFGISDYGEVMPFQYPLGNEHLAVGNFVSGYTVAYVAGGQDHVGYSAYASRFGITPVSYREIRNTPEVVEVEVATRTSDGYLGITQHFMFLKATRFLTVTAHVSNLQDAPLSGVVFKWVTDWDVDETYEGDTWDYDTGRNMVFAWENNYVAMASVEPPSLMDIDGWNDYQTRTTTVDYPTGPVPDYDGMEVLHFELGTLTAGASTTIHAAYGAGSDLAGLRQAIDQGRAWVSWLDLDATSGTVPAGSSRNVLVTFDATGLNGGDYDAQIVVTSDDPDSPEVTVPARLHVTGAPVIAVTPAALDFGQVFVGVPSTKTVTVANTGTDLLKVTSVAADFPDFTADVSSFTLAAGERRDVAVTYRPGAAGVVATTLSFESDDLVRPVVKVTLGGQGLIPPAIAVSPASFSESLFTGASVTRTLTIANPGGSDLNFTIDIKSGASAARAAIGAARLQDPDPERVEPVSPAAALTRYDAGTAPSRGPIAPDPAPGNGAGAGGLSILILDSNSYVSEIQSLLQSFPDVSVVDTFDAYYQVPSLAQLSPYDAVIVANGYPFSNPVGVGNVLADYVDDGGGVVLTVASFITQWSVSGRFVSGGYMPLVNAYGPAGSATLGTFEASHPIMRGVTSAWGDVLAGATLAEDAKLVASWSNGFPFVATKGPHVAVVNAFVAETGYWAGDVPLIVHNAASFCSRLRWLAVGTDRGVVPAGGTVDVSVTFDATGLNGGGYDARIVVTSNDPEAPQVTVPTHLHVTGAPVIAVTPAALDFGRVFVGVTSAKTVTVANTGTDVLTVTNVGADLGDFTADVSSFTLPVGGRRDVTVTYRPSAAGVVAGTLSFASNDPGNPLATVTLGGEGLIPPVISASPASLSESLFTGQSVTRTLTIANTGGSDLTFDVAIGHGTAAAVSAAARPSARLGALGNVGAGSTVSPRSDVPPESATVVPVVASRTAGADVLLLEDVAPWGTFANEQVLASNGFTFDTVGSGALAGTNLDQYRLLIVASDQPASFYAVLATQLGRIDAWVASGGVLEFHTASQGWQTGDTSTLTLPRGMRLQQRHVGVNYVLDPTHPLVSGVPAAFHGDQASHTSFTNIPADASLVASDDIGQPDLVVYREGQGYVVAGGQPLEFALAHGWDGGQILANMIPYAHALKPPWVAVDPPRGVVPAGGTVDLTVTFDATGLYGGDYDAQIVVTSNDPVTPAVTVPAHLHVTGAPVIALTPAALDFDQVFVGVASTKTVTVANTGTDVLTVTNVAADVGDFTADVSSFNLAAGERRDVAVTYRPSAAGVVAGSLSFATNDPGHPLATVSLGGQGLIPPVISASPASFSESLFTGQSVTRTLTIANTGGSDLNFGVAIGRGAASVASRTAGADVLLLQDVAPWDTFANEQILAANGIAFDTAGSGALPGANLAQYRLLIVASDQPQSFYAALATQLGRIDAWVAAGGVLEFHAASDGWQSGDTSTLTLPRGMRMQQRHVSVNYVLDPTHPLVSGVPAMFSASTVSFASFTNIPAEASLVASDDIGQPDLVVYREGQGFVVAGGGTLEYGYTYGWDVGRILANMIPYAHALQPQWVVVDSHEGVVPAGGTVDLTVTFDATGLNGGDYDAQLVVTSNDPVSPEVTVPAHLHVTGAPVIAVTPAGLDFGQVFVGVPSTKTVTVANAGTDVLTVTNVATDVSDITADVSSFTLPIGGRRDVTVTYRPSAAGVVAGRLSFASNDPGKPLVTVSLGGEGLIPPVISVSPASLPASLFTGTSVTRTLTIANTGGSDLRFDAAIGRGVAGVGSRTPGTDVLLLQDVAPWGTTANEQILGADGLAFDRIGSAALLGANLAQYRLLIVASDQPASFYAVLATQLDRIDAWVASGGVLEFHTASLGWQSGDTSTLTLPRGMRIQQRHATVNHVLDPTHPLVIGVPAVFNGSVASFTSFTNIPADASLVASDDVGQPNLVVYREHQGYVVAGGQAFEYGYTYGWPLGRILANMIPYAHALQPQWISIGSYGGVVHAGGAVDLAVTFDATGLYGGEYDAHIVVTSNDPAAPEVTVPAPLYVTGAPVISVTPAALDFGQLFIGVPSTRTVSVANTGTDVLAVTNVAADLGDFTADVSSFTLAIGERRDVRVTYTPSVAGVVAGTLSFESNDPGHPLVTVSLGGQGLVPPHLAVTPASLSASLLTGQSVTRTLTIANTGGSDLSFDVAVGSGTAVLASRTAGADVLLLEDVAPWGTSSNEQILAENGIAFDTIGSGALLGANLAPYRLLIVGSDQPASFYAVLATQLPRIGAWVASGGVLEFHAASGGWSNGDTSTLTLPRGMRMQARHAYTNLVLDPTHPLVDGVPAVLSGNPVSFTSFTNIPADAALVASDDTGQPNLVVYREGQGYVVAGGQAFEFGLAYGWQLGRVLSNMIPYAHTLQPPWVVVDSHGGVVPAGGAVDLSVIFDATGLNGGGYDARIEVTSNDPEAPAVTVPAHLHVIGAPVISVTPADLDFGQVLVGVPSTRTVTVANTGTDDLTVTNVATSLGDFTADVSSFTLAIGGQRDVTVTYRPSVAGVVAGALSFASNDPGKPLVTVSLGGQGLVPPNIAVSPASLSESLSTGASVTRTLRIANTGGSDLSFGVSIGSATPAVGSRAAGADVLLLKDVAPWGTSSNEQILAANGVAFDTIGSGALLGANLAPYRLLIVASDQPASFYAALATQLPRIGAWVASGGVLEFHAASGAWSNGDTSTLTLPRGMRVVRWRANVNYVLDLTHPLVSGAPASFGGNPVSFASFANVPADASLVASDDAGQPDLVVYREGQGFVVAGGQAFEYGFAYGWDVGRILANMIPYAHALQPEWISVDSHGGVVPPGGAVDVSVTFDASGLDGGEYDAQVVVTSNDPDDGRVSVGAHLHVRCTGTESQCAPVAVCNDVTVAADGLCAGHASADSVGVGSHDPNGRPLTYSLDSGGPFGLGATPVTLTVTNDDGMSSTCHGTVTVVDVTPPELSLQLAPNRLWPPYKEMVPVEVVATATDNCRMGSVVLTSVVSSEFDGNAAPDIADATPGTADYHFELRADRADGGPGRVYTATYSVTDGAGNTRSASAYALVPNYRTCVVHPPLADPVETGTARMGRDPGLRIAPMDPPCVLDPMDIRLEPTAAGTRVTWKAAAGARSYDVIRGKKAAIQATNVVVGLGPVTCIEHDSADLSTAGHEDAEVPAPGELFFYLVQYDDGISTSYGEGSGKKPRAPGPGACD